MTRTSGGKDITFTLYDARPALMQRFIELLVAAGGCLIPEDDIERDGERLVVTWLARVPPGALFGYYVVPAPNPKYLRCVIFSERDNADVMQDVLRYMCEVNFASTIDMAQRRAAESVPALMAANGLRTAGEPLVWHGDPDCGGMAALRELVRATYDDDLTPAYRDQPYKVVRVGDAIVFTLAFEVHSLDPFVVMLHYGSEASGHRFRTYFDLGEASGPPPPDRRKEALRTMKVSAERDRR